VFGERHQCLRADHAAVAAQLGGKRQAQHSAGLPVLRRAGRAAGLDRLDQHAKVLHPRRDHLRQQVTGCLNAENALDRLEPPRFHGHVRLPVLRRERDDRSARIMGKR
jgi:hypothetical protein